jgi:hypothetical protein
VRSLLAVDLGLRTGVALFGDDGRLRWYRSQNFGTAPRLRRAVPGVLGELRDLAWLVLEGGGPLAEIWEREAGRRRIPVLRHPGEAASGRAGPPGRSTGPGRRARPTSLRPDAAEAIAVGLWGVLEVGWLDPLPEVLRR